MPELMKRAMAGGQNQILHPSRQRMPTTHMNRNIDFTAVDAAALPSLPLILLRWLPDGKRRGREFVAKNPTRADRTPGSFSINLVTGKWADFATNARGSGVISLAAYLFRLSKPDAARFVAGMLGIREGQK
jgi:hypothetical protein